MGWRERWRHYRWTHIPQYLALRALQGLAVGALIWFCVWLSIDRVRPPNPPLFFAALSVFFVVLNVGVGVANVSWADAREYRRSLAGEAVDVGREVPPAM